MSASTIVHLEQFLPPWVVARIAGHSLDIHMAHYSTNDSHLPQQRDRSYGEFDVLSEAGKEMAAKYQQPALIRTLLEQGKLPFRVHRCYPRLPIKLPKGHANPATSRHW